MRRQFDSYEEFAREELRCHRSSSWSIDEIVEEFLVCADLDLDADNDESDREEEDDEDE